jgi:hypothetical protein
VLAIVVLVILVFVCQQAYIYHILKCHDLT